MREAGCMTSEPVSFDHAHWSIVVEVAVCHGDGLSVVDIQSSLRE